MRFSLTQGDECSFSLSSKNVTVSFDIVQIQSNVDFEVTDSVMVFSDVLWARLSINDDEEGLQML